MTSPSSPSPDVLRVRRYLDSNVWVVQHPASGAELRVPHHAVEAERLHSLFLHPRPPRGERAALARCVRRALEHYRDHPEAWVRIHPAAT